MVEYELTIGGYDVFVDKKKFGCIGAGAKFFTSPANLHDLVRLTAKDLREIADKLDKEKGKL